MNRPPPRRLLAVARALVALGMALAVALPLWLWLGGEAARAVLAEAAGVRAASGAFAGNQLAWGLFASLPLSLLGLAALAQLWRWFGEVGNGRALERVALGRLRSFAWLWVALALAKPLVQAAWSVVMTMGHPPGQRMLVLSLGSHDYLQLLPGCVLLLVAHVMHDAVAAVEDNRAIV